MIGAVYHPPRPGLPFVAIIFSGSEIIETETVLSESEGEEWLATVIAAITARLEDGSEA
jgi:hypothetical protein